MIEIVIRTLDEAHDKLLSRIPKTKSQIVYVNIEDVSPLKLMEFMKENNIPDDANFDGEPNGYDAYKNICLSYYIDVPLTEKDILTYKIANFQSIACQMISDALKLNGYVKVGFDSLEFRKFKHISLYQLYVDKDFDSIFKYFTQVYLFKKLK